MKLCRLLFAVFLLLFGPSLTSNAQTQNFIFHNLGERQGLSANYSYSLLKDSRGYLWVGTINGLSRFDGSHFYNFKAGINNNLAVKNEILDLCEDKNGNIWGATTSGIFCYETAKNNFINYAPPTVEFARVILNIVCDSSGDIWANSEWNIVKLNKQKNIFEEVARLTSHKDSLRAYAMRQNGLLQDPSGKGLWIASRKGLHFYDIAQQKFYNYKNTPGHEVFTPNSVSALYLSASANCWFFDNTSKEIISFSTNDHGITNRIYVGHQYPKAVAQTVFEDADNRVWLSTWGGEMVVIDYKKNVFSPVSYKTDDPLSIAGDGFWSVLQDEDKNLWIASPGGISKCNYSKNVYSIIPLVENVPEFKKNPLGIFNIDPRDKSWWIGDEATAAVIHYFPGTGKYIPFDFSKAGVNSKGLGPGQGYSINFLNNEPYACTYNGIWKLDEKTKQVIPFEPRIEGMPPMNFYFVKENNGNVWYASAMGIVKYNKLSKKPVYIKFDIDTLPDGQQPGYSRLAFDKAGRPWFYPAFGWLGTVDNNNKVKLSYFIKNKQKELSGYITSAIAANDDNLWLAGYGIGLYKYNTGSRVIKLFDQSKGVSAFINSVVLDTLGRVWYGAKNKIGIFDPGTESVTEFALPISENRMSYHNFLSLTSDNEIIATVDKVIVKFVPALMNQQPLLKPPVISLIKIAGKDQIYIDEKELKLEPDQNSLEFNFGSFISNEMYPYTFKYSLEGFDKDWVSATANPAALYSNLNPGNYTFKVKAVANDRSWQTEMKTLSFTIRTPFYRARWFWFLMGMLLVATIASFYRFRLHKHKQIFDLQSKAQQLEKEKALVMYEGLKQQLNPHFLFNSLTSLNSLINIDPRSASEFLDNLSKIYRYILKSRDNETVSLRDELSFASSYIQLQQTRLGSGLVVNCNVQEECMDCKIVPVTLQNLIENAIKHNVVDEDSPLVIDIFTEGEYLVVQNNLQKKFFVESSNKQGLANFSALYAYLSRKPLEIKENNNYFTIKIPLL